jgi:hypothetical protein
LLGFFSPRNQLRIDDLAVSSGVTAAEWFRTLRSVYPQLTFTASDQVLYLIEAAVRNSRAVYIVEPKGEPIQYIYPPFVVSLAEDNHPGFLINRLVQRYAKKRWHDSLASQFRIPPEFDGTEPSPPYVDLPAFRLAKISLVHPEVLALRSSAFQFTEHSVFSPLPHSSDVIRTMNILNRAYFPESELRRAISAIHQSLTPGGLWIVGRTVSEHPPAHDVSVLRKMQVGWSVITHVGNGSEVEALACTPHLEPAHA